MLLGPGPVSASASLRALDGVEVHVLDAGVEPLGETQIEALRRTTQTSLSGFYLLAAQADPWRT